MANGINPITQPDDDVIQPPPPPPNAGLLGLKDNIVQKASNIFSNATGTANEPSTPQVGERFQTRPDPLTPGEASAPSFAGGVAPPEPIKLEDDVTTQESKVTTPKPVAPEPLPTTVAPTVEEKPLEAKKEGAVATEKPKPAPATEVDKIVDTGLDKQRDDIDQAGMDFIQQMMEGEDPIAELAFNWQMQKLGPIFGAENDALILKLKQQGIAGKNAGTAWISNMARRQGVQVADIVNRINFESAQRIEEWNRYGPERANQILNNRLNYRVDKYDFGMQQIKDLQLLGETDPQTYVNIGAANGVQISPETAQFISENIAAENEADQSAALREVNSNYRAIENDLEAQVPGIAVDGSALASLPPEAQADVRARIKEINRAIKDNDVAGAQAMMQELKELYPNAVIGDYTAWNPNDFRTHADNQAVQTFKADAKLVLDQGDIDGAAKILMDKVIDPTTAEQKFADLWATASPERKARLLESTGIDGEPITPEDKMEILAHDMLEGMQKTTVDDIFKAYFNNAKGVEINGVPLQEWLLEPENETATRSWIFQVTSGPYEINDDGTIVPVEGQQLPPWNPDSNSSHYFTDWPMADAFNENDDALNITYDGNNPYDDDNVFQTSEGYGNYRGQMDDAWESYVKGGGNLTRDEWFEAVKPVWDGSNVIFNGEAPKTRGEGEFDPVTAQLDFTQESKQDFDSSINERANLLHLGDEKLTSVAVSDPGMVDQMRQSGYKEASSEELQGLTNVEQLLAFMPVDADGNPFPMVDAAGNDLAQLEFIMIVDGRPFKITRPVSSNEDGSMDIFGKFMDVPAEQQTEVKF